MIFPRRARTATLVVVALLTGVLASDVAGLPGCQDCRKAPTATAAAPQAVAKPQPPVVGVSPSDRAVGISPAAPVSAEVLDGTITAVSLVDDWGMAVNGRISPDKSSWTATDRLDFARNYTMTVRSTSNTGVPLTRTSTFSTLYAGNYVHPYLEVQGGNAIHEDQRYGIGTIVVAHFDEPIADKALAEKNMTVTTEPALEGAWHWVSDTKAHWRPKNYYPAGTRVTAELNMFGLKLGDGLYGQADATSSFTIGDARIAVANDITKQVSLFENGRLVRTMPTSMGRGGTTTVAGRTFSWWTPPGTYVVLDKGEVVTMDSSTYGMPAGTADSYKRQIGYATRISLDGIYLHQLDDTVWAQGNTNLSHGCLNLSGENAKFYFDWAQPGDIVEVRFTGGPSLTLAEGGDWTMPWNQWIKGSALTDGPVALAQSKPTVTPAPGP